MSVEPAVTGTLVVDSRQPYNKVIRENFIILIKNTTIILILTFCSADAWLVAGAAPVTGVVVTGLAGAVSGAVFGPGAAEVLVALLGI